LGCFSGFPVLAVRLSGDAWRKNSPVWVADFFGRLRPTSA
jgi:hypothetical protein